MYRPSGKDAPGQGRSGPTDFLHTVSVIESHVSRILRRVPTSRCGIRLTGPSDVGDSTVPCPKC